MPITEFMLILSVCVDFTNRAVALKLSLIKNKKKIESVSVTEWHQVTSDI